MSDALSVYELIANASWPVLVIMAGLLIASFVSWTMIFSRWITLSRALTDMREFEASFWRGTDLRELYAELQEHEDRTGIEEIFVAAFGEYERLADEAGANPDAVMTGVQRATRVAVTREEASLEKHLGFLATLGSTAPYIGLFGTVIGIMNSFRTLANMSQATLASVAPGISEALLATALGLFAAIPAVIGFNRFSARVEVLTKEYEAFVDELSGILFRATHGEKTDG